MKTLQRLKDILVGKRGNACKSSKLGALKINPLMTFKTVEVDAEGDEKANVFLLSLASRIKCLQVDREVEVFGGILHFTNALPQRLTMHALSSRFMHIVQNVEQKEWKICNSSNFCMNQPQLGTLSKSRHDPRLRRD